MTDIEGFLTIYGHSDNLLNNKSRYPLKSYHKTGQSATKEKYVFFVEPLLLDCGHVIRLQSLFHLKEVTNFLLLFLLLVGCFLMFLLLLFIITMIIYSLHILAT